MARFNITTAVKEELETLASRLPKYLILNHKGVPSTLTRTLAGTNIINHWADYHKLFPGQGVRDINKKGKYIIKFPSVWVEHLPAIKDAYRRQGNEGVKEYLLKAEEQYQRYQAYLNKNHEETPSANTL